MTQPATMDRVAKASVEVVKREDGTLGWRSLDEDGKALRPRFGKIYGFDDDAQQRSAAYQQSVRIIDKVLLAVSEGGQVSSAHALKKRREARAGGELKYLVGVKKRRKRGKSAGTG